MGVPRAHRTIGASGRRRSHLALKNRSFAKCANCGEACMPHSACPSCGYYKGRQAVKPKVKKKKT